VVDDGRRDEDRWVCGYSVREDRLAKGEGPGK